MSFWQRGRRSLARMMGIDLTHTQVHYARVLDEYVHPGCRWLEVGCGRQILPDWAMPLPQQRELARRARLLIGMDVDTALHEHPLLTHRLIGLGNAMPFRPGSFNLITANMVVEHIERPEEFLREIHRVLDPGGCFLFHTTNFNNLVVFVSYFAPESIKERIVWLLEKRRPEDIFPTRYQMNTIARIGDIAAGASMRIERLSVNGTSGWFGNLGPLGWAELLMMKTVSLATGAYNSNLICVLRRE